MSQNTNKKLTPNSQPTEEYKKKLFGLYSAILKSDVDEKKKKNLLTYLFAWEDWSWRIDGISFGSLKCLKEKDFYPKPKGLVRHHYKQDRAKTYQIMLDKTLDFESWWKTFWNNDCTWLITTEEHKNINSMTSSDIKKNIINIDWTEGYFKGGGLVGFKYRKSIEAQYVKKLYADRKI